MHTNVHKNEHDDDSQRFHLLKTQSPSLYDEEITTINKEENRHINKMSTTTWETSPIRRVNLISGPHSAFARLFPDKYRQQEEFIEKQRSKSSDNHQHSNIDRFRISDDDDDDIDNKGVRKSRRVRFYTNEDETLKTRTKSEPYLNQMSMSEFCPDDVNYDPNPEIIRHNNPDNITYTQKVGVRYLKPPTPPPPGPILIREIQSTPPNDPPPLVVSTTPPIPPRTPSPIIVREQPPTPPEYQPTKVITKTLPPPPTRPRRVIIKRMPPLPSKPRPVIIEKWLPYKTTTERPILYQRTENNQQIRPAQRNLILQYDPPHVHIRQEVQNFGCFCVDPKIYQAQHGPSLRRTESIRRVLEKIGCNPDLITSTGYNTPYSSSLNQTNNYSHYDYPRQTIATAKTCFTDEQLDALIGSSVPPSSSSITEHVYDIPRIYDEDGIQMQSTV